MSEIRLDALHKSSHLGWDVKMAGSMANSHSATEENLSTRSTEEPREELVLEATGDKGRQCHSKLDEASVSRTGEPGKKDLQKKEPH